MQKEDSQQEKDIFVVLKAFINYLKQKPKKALTTV